MVQPSQQAPGYDPPSADADRATLSAVAGLTGERIQQYTLHGTGIVLRIKGVPQQAIRAAAARIPDPAVPIAQLSNGNTEPNPNHPDYARGLMKAANDRIMAQYTTALIMGTEVLDVPAGMHRPESDEWVEEVEAALSIEVEGAGDSAAVVVKREPRLARYLDYLRLYAITDPADEFILSMLLVQGVALSEREVEAAMSSFRHRQRRDAFVVLPDAFPDFDRADDAARDPGDGAGVRGTPSVPLEQLQLVDVDEPVAG